MRSFVKELSSSFVIDGGRRKSAFSIGIINFGLSLNVPIDWSLSNVEFQSFVDSLQFTAAPKIITDYDALFKGGNDNDRRMSFEENVLLSIEDYGSPHSPSFSKMVSALEKNTKVRFIIFNLYILIILSEIVASEFVFPTLCNKCTGIYVDVDVLFIFSFF